MIAVLMPTTSPAAVDQRPAGIAGIERGVGLDDAVDEPARARAQAAAEGADHAGGHRRLEAEGIADGDDELADAQLRASPRRAKAGASPAEPQHREIGVGIVADQAGRHGAAIGEGRLEALGAGDHMAVGEDIAVGREDHARAGAALALGGLDRRWSTAGPTSSTAPVTARE